MLTTSTSDCCEREHSAPAVFPAAAQIRRELRLSARQSCARRNTTGSHSALPPTPTSNSCTCGNARPWRIAAPHPLRLQCSSKSLATSVRNLPLLCRLSSSPWLISLLERQPAEPALLPSSGQQIAQHQSRPQQPRLHRSHRNSQRFGRLLNV